MSPFSMWERDIHPSKIHTWMTTLLLLMYIFLFQKRKLSLTLFRSSGWYKGTAFVFPLFAAWFWFWIRATWLELYLFYLFYFSILCIFLFYLTGIGLLVKFHKRTQNWKFEVGTFGYVITSGCILSEGAYCVRPPLKKAINHQNKPLFF